MACVDAAELYAVTYLGGGSGYGQPPQPKIVANHAIKRYWTYPRRLVRDARGDRYWAGNRLDWGNAGRAP
jgi:hypothetical protein